MVCLIFKISGPTSQPGEGSGETSERGLLVCKVGL